MPFSINDSALAHLIIAVNIDENIAAGLPTVILPEYTIKDLANDTTSVAQMSGPHRITAPFLTKSHFIYLIRIAYTVARSLLPSLSNEDANKKLADIISIVINNLQLHFIPWAPDVPVNHRGPAPYKPSPFHWRMVVAISQAEQQRQRTRMENQSVHGQARLAVQNMRSNSGMGSWSIVKVSLTDLKTIFKKQAPPIEFNLNKAVIDRDPTSRWIWIAEHYDWLIKNFSMQNPAHRLCLYAGHIVCALLPSIFIDKTFHFPTKLHGKSAVIEALQAAPIDDRINRKGHTSPAPMLLNFLAQTVGLIHGTSPLRVYVNQNHAFGAGWTAKHGMLLCCQYIYL